MVTILLVEDNRADADITIRAFKKSGFNDHIILAQDGLEAMEIMQGEGIFSDKEKYPPPDLILLDIKLPKLDGFQILERLKKDIRTKNIPVIMLSSSRNEEDILRSYELGCASYIPKPVSYDEFLELIIGFNKYWHQINIFPKK